MDRKCRCCNAIKVIDEFPVAGIIKGKLYRRHKCNVCYVEMKSERRRQIARWLEGVKKTLKCSQCGNDDFRVLEFHHTEENKSFNVSEAVQHGLSKAKILQEIAIRCVLTATGYSLMRRERIPPIWCNLETHELWEFGKPFKSDIGDFFYEVGSATNTRSDRAHVGQVKNA